jgi:uncharacterized membrane protein YvbJ
MAETLKCPLCGSEGQFTASQCTKCSVYIRSELDILRDVDVSLKTVNASLKVIKDIVICWLILSLFAVAVAFIYAASGGRI